MAHQYFLLYVFVVLSCYFYFLCPIAIVLHPVIRLVRWPKSHKLLNEDTSYAQNYSGVSNAHTQSNRIDEGKKKTTKIRDEMEYILNSSSITITITICNAIESNGLKVQCTAYQYGRWTFQATAYWIDTCSNSLSLRWFGCLSVANDCL